MTDSDNRYLVIDLEKCDGCERCGVVCDVYHRDDPADNGIMALRERATFELVCRRCEHASCVIACPFDALEKGPGGVIERHNMRCVSCKSCAHACPFGTIYPEMLPFYQTVCDDCLAQHSQHPPCVESCVRAALEFRRADAAETNLHLLDGQLAARYVKWVKHEVTE